MLYTEMTSKALSLCYQIHQNDYDLQGTPYVFHPFAMANEMNSEQEICTALLQGVFDQNTISEEELKSYGFCEEILQALHLLHKPRTMDYFSYIRRLKTNPLARKVKCADLRCTLESCTNCAECLALTKSREQQMQALQMLA